MGSSEEESKKCTQRLFEEIRTKHFSTLSKDTNIFNNRYLRSSVSPSIMNSGRATLRHTKNQAVGKQWQKKFEQSKGEVTHNISSYKKFLIKILKAIKQQAYIFKC